MTHEIYELGLHDACWIEKDQISVFRVPGGWIYESIDEGQVRWAIFVPHNNEFKSNQP